MSEYFPVDLVCDIMKLSAERIHNHFKRQAAKKEQEEQEPEDKEKSIGD